MSDDAQLTNFFVNLRDSRVHLPAMASDAIARAAVAIDAQDEPGTTRHRIPTSCRCWKKARSIRRSTPHCTVPECHLDMFQADARTRGTGVLRVHTFGGGTWVSEFATLTGMPQDIFGPGRHVCALRAGAARARRAGNAVAAAGFSPSRSIRPKAASSTDATPTSRMASIISTTSTSSVWTNGKKPTSRCSMRPSASTIKVKKPGQPVFIMILTINQHGPHDDPMSSCHRRSSGLLQGLSPAATALNFDTYLSRLHDSDVAMRGLEHDFLDRAQPTVLVHFGDHQPSFDDLMRTLPRTLPPALQPYQDYLTYYMIKSNFAGAPLPTYPMLDIAFLPSMVLQASGCRRILTFPR
jgi:hypothetical protein